MKTRCAVAVLAILTAPYLAASAQDHLEPESGLLNATEWEWNYSKQLREVLLKDAATYHLARMVCLPSFEPEWVVTIVREVAKDDDEPCSYFVEFVGANEKHSSRKDSQKIKVTKLRATLDRETAEALNTTWRQMLRASRYPDKHRIGADGVDYHFSRFVPIIFRGKTDPLAGWEQGKIWSPDDQSLSGELVTIGEALKEYVLAVPKERDKIKLEIQGKVNRLESKLDRPKKP